MTSILFVDTNTEMCHLVRHMFEETGEMLVYLAGSGEEAIISSCRNQLDAIISDYHLPGMSGVSLLKRLRLLGICVPFIFFTQDFMTPLNEVVRLPNVFRFNGKRDLEKREILRLLRIVYWVTGNPDQGGVMPGIIGDEQRGYRRRV
ncbi:response regulator [uncultured Methanoregula sp.]|uniref:response regulator n=1 Tax=uncultured Methanoregula sp. TaxID=1005933 RepID=UPI002AABCBE2|nr:response regulator [uncultured Methanoregula sp.]